MKGLQSLQEILAPARQKGGSTSSLQQAVWRHCFSTPALWVLLLSLLPSYLEVRLYI